MVFIPYPVPFLNKPDFGWRKVSQSQQMSVKQPSFITLSPEVMGIKLSSISRQGNTVPFFSLVMGND